MAALAPNDIPSIETPPRNGKHNGIMPQDPGIATPTTSATTNPPAIMLQRPPISAPPAPVKSITVWQGTLAWTDFDSTGKAIEASSFVMAGTTHYDYTLSETWPERIKLFLTQDPVVPTPEVHLWLQRYRPALVTFRAQPYAIADPGKNQQCFKRLIQLLNAKRVYATAGWVLPSGHQRNVVVFFLVNTTELVGGVFPVAGVPDIPRPLPTTAPKSAAAPVLEQGLQTPLQNTTLGSTNMKALESNENSSVSTGPKLETTDVWHGSLTWTVDDGTGAKELATYVAAHTSNPAQSAAKTWPSSMHVTHTNDTIVSVADLQAWLRRTRPITCQFTLPPPANVQEPQINEQAYKYLFNYLCSKQVYAVAAWTLPSGRKCNNIIFVPLSKIGVVGIVFPLYGIPAMPKPLAPAPYSNRLQPMTLEQRDAVLVQIKRRWDLQLHQMRFLRARLHTARTKQQQEVNP